MLSERLVAEVMPAGFAFRPIVSPAPQVEIGPIAAELAGEIAGAEVEARHEARALLSDILPLSPADWLSEANSLAGR